MIANTALWVVIIGVISSFKVGIKADKWLSWLSFISVFFVFNYFISGMNKNTEDILSFVWNSSVAGNINVDLITNKYNCLQILPFFIITLASVSNNILLRYEEHRSLYDSFLLFNLFSLIIMITSNNFVQLLSALFLVDILSFFIIKDIENTKKIMIMNLIADMLLFSCMAIINADVHSLNISQIDVFSDTGFRLHFISGIGLISILIKFGIFPFHEIFSDLKYTRFHRLQNILYLTSPASALILLIKFYSLWSKSYLFIHFFIGVLLLNFLIGSISFLRSDSLKEKIINLQMIFWSLILYLLSNQNFVWNIQLARLFLCSWILGSVLYFIYNSSNRHDNLSEISRLQLCNTSTIVCSIFITFFAIKITFPLLFDEFLQHKDYVLLCFILGILICYSALLKMLYITNTNYLSTNKKQSPINLRLIIVPLTIICYLIFTANLNLQYITMSVGIFILFILLYPHKMLTMKYADNNENNSTPYFKLYQTILINPLYKIGRFFGLLIDWLVVEKIIIGAIILCFQSSITFFRNLHNSKTWGIVMVIFVIIAGLCLSYWEGINN